MVGQEQRELEIVATVKDLATRAFKRMRKVVGGVAKGIIGSFRGVVRILTSLQTMIIAIGTALVAGKVAQHLIEVAESVDEIAKSARRLNLPVETLSELRTVAEFSGVEFEKLRAGLRLFQKQLVDAGEGVETALEPFQVLGVEVRDNAGRLRDTEAVLNDVADAYVVFGEGAKRAALGQRLFGEESSDVTTLLEGGAQGLRNLRKEARALGTTITADTAAELEGFNDSLTRMRSALSAVSRELVTAIAGKATPILNDLARTIRENREEIVRFLERVGVGFLQVLRDVGAAVLRFADLTGDIFGSKRSGIRKEIAALSGDVELYERALKRAESRLGLFDKKVREGKPIRETLFSKEASDRASDWNRIVRLSTGAVFELREQGLGLREAQVKNIEALKLELERRRGLVVGKRDELNANENLIASLDALIARYENASRSSSGFLDEMARLRKEAKALPSIFDQAGPRSVFDLDPATAAGGLTPKQAEIAEKQRQDRIRREAEAEDAVKRKVAAVQREIAVLRATGRERELLEIDAQIAARIDALDDAGEQEAELVKAHEDLKTALRAEGARQRQQIEGTSLQGIKEGLREFQEEAQNTFQLGKQAALDFVGAVRGQLSTAISSIILRTKSAKQAFKDFARGVVESIANIIAELLALKAISLVLSLIPGGSGFTTIFGNLGGTQRSRFRGGNLGGGTDTRSTNPIGTGGRGGSGPLGANGGSVVVMHNTFEIRANDARGIRELLVENFQTIEDNMLRVVSTKPKVRRAFAAIR